MKNVLKLSYSLLMIVSVMSQNQPTTESPNNNHFQNARELVLSSNLNQLSYSQQIINDDQDVCQPLSCQLNCCSAEYTCPISRNNCKYNQCDDSMCTESGCCIFGVCRQSSECKSSKIARGISLAIIIIFGSGIVQFQDKIKIYVKSKQLFSQEEENLHKFLNKIPENNQKDIQKQQNSIFPLKQLKNYKIEVFQAAFQSSGSGLKVDTQNISQNIINSLNHSINTQKQQNLPSIIPTNTPSPINNSSTIANNIPN